VILAFADVELDLDRYELRRSGMRVPVEPQVFDVLVHLARNTGRVMPKEELLDTVWGDRFVSESALTSRIKSARRAVGDNGQRQAIIATVYGRGYRIVVPVHEQQRQHAPDAAFVVTGPSAPATHEPSPAVGRTGATLLEREVPLHQLTEAVRAASSGGGRVVCVAGQAGLGKSSLVQNFADDVAGAAVVLVGAADDLTTPRPLGAIQDVVEQLPAAARASLPDELRGEQLLPALEALASETGAPVVVVVEDLHWADDATLDIVRYLARRVRTSPVVLVVTYRDEPLEAGSSLRQLLGSLRGPAVERVTLSPLTPSGVATLAEGSIHDPREVYDATGGNPLFVTELLAAPPGPVPSSVRDVVLARCGQLPRPAFEALCLLAVAPARLERSIGRDLVAGGESTWLDGERAGLLDGDNTHVWFRHELVRRAIEETLTPSEHVQAHLSVARLLDARGGELARIVHHAALADDAELVLKVGPRAAAEAERAGAHRQVAQHLETVLRHAERLTPAEHAALLTRRAHSLYLVNRFEDSLTCAEQAVAIAGPLDDQVLLARALLTLGRTVLWARGPDAASAVEQRVLDLLGPDGDAELRAIAHADLARALGELVTIGSVAQGNPLALEHASRAFVLADQLGRSDLRGYALMYRGSERLAHGDPNGAADLDEAISLLRAFPRHDLVVRACVNASGAAYRAGRFSDAERYVELGLRLSQDAEFFSGEYRLALTRASVRASLGRWSEAVAELRSVLALRGEPGIMEPIARSLLGRLLARQGHSDEADRVLRPAEAPGTDFELRVYGPVTIARVELSWLAGGEDDLLEVADDALVRARTTGNTAILAELSRYLQRAGFSPAPVVGAPEPWASGLRGAWPHAAAQWAARNEPYEQALELATGDDDLARAKAAEMLRSLGAHGALTALRRADGRLSR
jgi:DNA-binding winged helix-turn-helix (wHTH) protein/tetratricopeptide (TPR) repeat protein